MQDNLRFAQMLRLLSDFPVLCSVVDLVPVILLSSTEQKMLGDHRLTSNGRKAKNRAENDKGTQTKAEMVRLWVKFNLKNSIFESRIYKICEKLENEKLQSYQISK